MYSIFLLCFFAGLTSAEYGWKVGTEYRYIVGGRTMVGKNSHFNGIDFKASLSVVPVTESLLSLKISGGQYGNYEGELVDGWDSAIPNPIQSQPLTFTQKPFELELKNGMVDKLMVEDTIPTWEVNMIKAISSAFQVDLKAENVKKSRFNKIPTLQEPTGIYMTIEDTITGKCETLYEVSPLPKEVLEKWPEVAPMRGDGQLIGITKTQNYSDCYKKPVYHSGITGYSNWEPASSKLGQFLSRINLGRIVISGSLQRYVIQSSVITSKIIVSPHVYNTEKVLVGSKMILTLDSVGPAMGEPVSLEKRRVIKDLVYEAGSGKAVGVEGKKSERFLWFGGEEEPKKEEGASNASEEEGTGRVVEEWSSGAGEPLDTPLRPPFEPPAPPTDLAQAATALAAASHDDPASFILLVRLIRTSMTAKQIQDLTEPLRASDKPSWWAVRDAVALAGTGPALLVLKEWILSGKVSGEEAAQLMAQLPSAAHNPTPSYLQTLFSLVTSPEFEMQNYLNLTGILAFSDLIRMASVDERESKSIYPRYWLGKPSPDNLTDTYIPLLKSKLETAISEENSIRIQLYTRAIGNIGHPKILSVFEPYIEGRQTVTNFQRLNMIVSLEKLTKVYPKEARSFLYKVYRNMTETTDIRVAAIMHLMKANPSAEMLQRMAEFTHIDPNHNVNAAVASAIQTAAVLTTSQSAMLANNARSALGLLPKKSYGNDKSKHFIRAFITKEQNLGYKQEQTFIRNDDNFLPNSIFYYIRRQMGGYKLPYKQFSAMTSSSSDLIERIIGCFKWQNESSPITFPSTLNSEKIAKMMKMEMRPQSELEGNFFLGFLGSNRFFPFDENSLSTIPEVLRYAADLLAQGEQFNFTKYYNLFSMSLGYPTITGLPFMYTIDIPTIFQIDGHVKMMTKSDVRTTLNKRDPIIIPNNIDASANLQLFYFLKTQSQVGFYTPFEQKHYLVGLDKNSKIQAHVSMKAFMDIKNGLAWVELEPAIKTQNQKILEQSTALYSSRQNTQFLVPSKRVESMHFIHSKPTQKYNLRIGENGISFDVAVEGPYKVDKARIMEWLRGHDIINVLLYYYAENNPTCNNITLSYNPNTSKASTVTFGFKIDRTNMGYSKEFEIETNAENYKKSNKHQNKNHKTVAGNNEENSAIPVDSSFESSQRQEQFLKQVNKGITNGTGSVLNMFMMFNGTKKSHYVITIAHGSSISSEKSRILLFLGKLLEDQQFLTAMDMKMKFPKLSLMNYKEAMRGASMLAFTIKASLKENSSPWKHFDINGYLNRSLDKEIHVKESSVGIKCVMEMMEGNNILLPCHNALSSARMFDQARLTFKFNQVPDYLKLLTSKIYDWIRYLGFDYLSQDTINNKSGNVIDIAANFTHNMKAINLSLTTPSTTASLNNIPTEEWIEALLYVTSQQDFYDGYTQEFLNGRSVCTLDQKAVTTFKNVTYPVSLNKGWNVILQHIPKSWGKQFGSRPEISVLVRDSSPKREMKILLENEMIDIKSEGAVNISGKGYEVSQLPGGIIHIVAPTYSFEALFDGTRVLLQVGTKYLGEIYGLCGRSRNHSECVLEGEMEEDSCGLLRIIATEDEGRLCFSVRSQMQCAPHCRATTMIEKVIDFHCVADSGVARHWMEMVKKGGSPDFGNKASAKKSAVQIPEKCVGK